MSRFLHRAPALRHAFFQGLLLLAACADPDSPEQRVRAVVAAMQVAAEARDTSDFMAFVAADFRNAEGRGFADVQRMIGGYLLAHQSVHLLTRIEGIEFPVPQEARVDLAVGMAGRQDSALTADLYEIELVLREVDGDWKVTYANWHRR